MTEILDLYPRLVVETADAALDFYTAAFGAQVLERYTDPYGRVVHAMVAAGPVRFAVKDADSHDPAPTAGGVRVVFAVDDHPYGERAGRLADPFGHVWMVARRTEQLTPQQIQDRTTAMYGS